MVSQLLLDKQVVVLARKAFSQLHLENQLQFFLDQGHFRQSLMSYSSDGLTTAMSCVLEDHPGAYAGSECSTIDSDGSVTSLFYKLHLECRLLPIKQRAYLLEGLLVSHRICQDSLIWQVWL